MGPAMTGGEWLRLGDLAAGPIRRRLELGADAREALSAQLGLEALPVLEADFEIRPWMDGCQIQGHFRGEVTQVCGVSLEVFTQSVVGDIDVRFAPIGSPHLPAEVEAGEIEVSLDTPDPPEALEGDLIDLNALLSEHLALAIDPFPRRPDAVFEWAPEAEVISPFAALSALKPPPE